MNRNVLVLWIFSYALTGCFYGDISVTVADKTESTANRARSQQTV